MLFRVLHATVYSYSAPVRLGPQALRLTPRPDAGRLIAHALEISPQPATLSTRRDSAGNLVAEAGFEGETARLEVVSRFELDVAMPPPLPDDLPGLPWAGAEAVDGAVAAFSDAVAAEAGGDAAAFLDALARALFARTDRRIRHEGNAHSAAQTLATRTGACRDLAVLFMACCARQGIPSRFASGYQARAEAVDGRRHLHAWPEALLPGAGWRGWDPTHGVRVTDGHVVLCAAPTQAETMTVSGGFWGPSGVRSTLSFTLEIEAEE